MLAEEATLENSQLSNSFVPAMLAPGNDSKENGLLLAEASSNTNGNQSSQYQTGNPSYSNGNSGGFNNCGNNYNYGGYNNAGNNYNSGGYRGSNFRGKTRGKNNFGNSRFPRYNFNNSLDILRPAKPYVSTCFEYGNDVPTCQICNKRCHVASKCFQRHSPTTVSSSPM